MKMYTTKVFLLFFIILFSTGNIFAKQVRLPSEMTFQIPKDLQKKLQVIQWSFEAGSKGRPILSGNHYRLVNNAIGQGIRHYKRVLGANLGYMSTSSKVFNMRVVRKKGNGQLRYGDLVALNLKPYGWIRYKKQGRSGGINLGDDDHRPHYIWKIRGGKKGTRVFSGMPFALYNTYPEKKEVIYCKRGSGIDLGWFPTSKCSSFLSKMSGVAFGKNGFLSGGGYSGRVVGKLKDYLCEVAVDAGAAYITAQTAGTGSLVVIAASQVAKRKCKNL